MKTGKLTAGQRTQQRRAAGQLHDLIARAAALLNCYKNQRQLGLSRDAVEYYHVIFDGAYEVEDYGVVYSIFNPQFIKEILKTREAEKERKE